MKDVDHVFKRIKTATEEMKVTLLRDDSTLDDVRKVSVVFDDIEADLENLIKNG